MSLDISDFWPSCFTNDDYQDQAGHLVISKVPDAELKAASEEMESAIHLYFGGPWDGLPHIDPNDEGAAYVVDYMLGALGNWKYVLEEIERRWKLKYLKNEAATPKEIRKYYDGRRAENAEKEKADFLAAGGVIDENGWYMPSPENDAFWAKEKAKTIAAGEDWPPQLEKDWP